MSLFEHEDYLTPTERAEALALFRPGKWKKGVRPHEAFADQIARFRLQEEGLPVTVRDRPFRRQPIVSVGELVALVGVSAAAFFAGRWWARHRRVKKQQSTQVRGNAYVLGALALAS